MSFHKFLSMIALGLLLSTQVLADGFPSSFPDSPLPGLPGSSAGGTKGTFANGFGSRGYTLYVPKRLNPNEGLLVVLHGCFLTGDQMAAGTEFNKYADQKGFAVLYPEQGYGDNAWKCWNWFKPENQRRDDGEASIIVGMTLDTIHKYNLNASRVFITGISAGGAMAANLLGCYSDVFAGGMIHSGLEFAAAQSETEAHQVTASGPTRDLDESARQALACSPPRNTLIPVIVIHGQADNFVNTINADRTFELFEKINAAIFTSAGGDASQVTLQQSRVEQGGYKFSADVTDAFFGKQDVMKKVMVEGMAHAWSGGQPTAPYMEPRGINAAKLAVDSFFP